MNAAEVTKARHGRQAISLVDLHKQNLIYMKEWMSAITPVIESGRFIGGEEVSKFEHEFAAYCGTQFAIGTGSGSDALRLALLALNIGIGDEVITVANTFVSTADAIVHSGANPVFVDVDPETFTMDPNQVRKVLGPRVKAIVPVHMYGHPAEMDSIKEIAGTSDVAVIEDAAHAHGATYGKKRCGSLGTMACFSFYPSKNLGSFGDAGMITTDDEHLANRLGLLRQYGEREKNKHELVGFNSRLDAIQAAILRRKLAHLDSWNKKRRELAHIYDENFERLDIQLPIERAPAQHVYHVYALHTERRDSLRSRLFREGIETGVHYPTPIHLQPAYSHIDFRSAGLGITESLAKRTLSIPMYPELSINEVATVCEFIKQWRLEQ